MDGKLEKLIYKNRFKNIIERNNIWTTLIKYFFQKFIDKNDVVLDVGCGYCEFINNIECKTKIALDINPDSKKFAAENITFLQGSSVKINLYSKSVDKIFISNFLEHLSKKDIILSIKEFNRILKKEGEVLILTPNIRLSVKNFWMIFDHITPIDDRALEEIFTLFDFSLKYKILRFLPFSIKDYYPKNSFFIMLYLHLPFVWFIFGKQSFLVFRIKK